jgi:hypothetical protein
MKLHALVSPPSPPAQPAIPLPAGILARAPLPDELVEAIAAALDREAVETDFIARAELLNGTRTAIQAWLEGSASTVQTVRTLHGLARAGEGG